RGETDDDVSRSAPRAVDESVTLDDADARPGEIELTLVIDPRQLRRLAADQGAPGRATDLRRSLDELHDLLLVDPARGDVVEHEERLRPSANDVVDAVRGEVHAGPVQAVGPPRQ